MMRVIRQKKLRKKQERDTKKYVKQMAASAKGASNMARGKTDVPGIAPIKENEPLDIM